MKKAIILLLAVPLALSSLSQALHGAQPEHASIRAVKVARAPKIDGYLSDPVWSEAEPFSAFRMVEPTAGGMPTERTEMRVVYDEAALYVAIHCFDREPKRIAANTLAHDDTGEESGMYGSGAKPKDDLVKVLLDPFLNKRTAYVFYVNARGAKSEGLVSSGSASLNWDGVWEAKSRIVADGWTAEMKIPFKTISFNPNLTSWGLNVERYIPRKIETIRISGLSRDSNFYNPMEASELQGISNIKQGLGITVKPYGLLKTQKDYDPVGDRRTKADGGVDIYKNITPNLTAAFSYNTDFAETEVDDRRINLTRFPLYYSEKRMFFLEGSETFDFSSSVSFKPFFSRRIGLYEGDQIPIIFGTKLYGKIGGTSLAVIDVETDSYGDLPKNNLFAARVTQDIFSESKVGVIVTNGSPTGERNTLLGADFNYTTSKFLGDKNLMVAAWGVYNWNDESGQHEGFGFRANYPNDLINISSTYAYYGQALDPGLGYMMREDIQTYFIDLSYNPRPTRGWVGDMVRQFFYSASADTYFYLDGRLATATLRFTPLSFMTESGETFSAGLTTIRDVLDDPFSMTSDVTIPAGTYNYTDANFSFSTATHKPLSFSLGYTVGRYYSGHYGDFSGGLTYHFKGNLNVYLGTELARGRLLEGAFRENVYQIKLDYYFSPDLGFMNYIQFDNQTNVLGWSARFRWEVTPGNFVYLVYNRNWDRTWDPTARFISSSEHGVFKVTLSIRP